MTTLLTLRNGKLTEFAPVSASAGALSSGSIVALDATGKLDASLIPPPAPIPTIRFVFEQAMASRRWVIAHGLNAYPDVFVLDSGGTRVEGDVNYPSSNQVIISFGSAFGGTAYLT